MEAWRAVRDWEGFYEVSDLGRVRSLRRTVPALDPHGRPGLRVYQGKVLRPGKGAKGGYPLVCLSSPGRREHRYVHDLVLRAFVGDPPDAHECCHSDGDNRNNALTNLRRGTSAENTADSIRHGTHPWVRARAALSEPAP